MHPITRYALWGILIIMVLALFYQCSSPGSGGGGVYYRPGYRGGSFNAAPGSSGGSRTTGGGFRGGGPSSGK